MKVHSHAFQILCVAAGVATLGCHSADRSPVVPGPVALRGGAGTTRANAHMRAFLVGDWRSVATPYELRATFFDDRRFVIQVAGADLGDVFPGVFQKGSWSAEGTWSATSEMLTLSRHGAAGSAQIPLTWLDGKLNIQVGEIQLHRIGWITVM